VHDSFEDGSAKIILPQGSLLLEDIFSHWPPEPCLYASPEQVKVSSASAFFAVFTVPCGRVLPNSLYTSFEIPYFDLSSSIFFFAVSFLLTVLDRIPINPHAAARGSDSSFKTAGPRTETSPVELAGSRRV